MPRDGNLVFDIKVVNYGTNTTGFTMKVDCGYPCTSGDQPILKAVVGLTGVLFVLALTVNDLLYSLVDPRVAKP